MNRVPLYMEVPLPDFIASLRVPLDLTLEEAHQVTSTIIDHAMQSDPREAGKFACVDPNVFPGITE